MSPLLSARRLAMALTGVVLGAAVTSGCSVGGSSAMPDERRGDTAAAGVAAAAGEATAMLAASAPRSALLSTRHDDADVRFVTDALAHLRQSVALARLMREEPPPDPAYAEVVERLLVDQGGQVALLEALLELWGADRPGMLLEVDGRAAADPRDPTDPTARNVDLLLGLTDSSGFAPFWLMTVQAHGDAFVARAREMRRDATSTDVRRFAAAFCDDHRALQRSLTALGA